MRFSANRRLLQALVLSLMLHAMILAGSGRDFPARPEMASGAIRGVLVPAADKTVEKAKTAGGSALPGAEKRLRMPQLPDRQAVADRAARVLPQAEVPSRELPAHADTVQGATAPVALKEVAGDRQPEALPDAQALEGVRADAIRQYRVWLAGSARRYKRYPAMARERGWQGTVQAEVVVFPQGGIPQVMLVRSSGRKLLDEHALKTLTQAVSVTAIPDALKSRGARVPILMEFSLEGGE